MAAMWTRAKHSLYCRCQNICKIQQFGFFCNISGQIERTERHTHKGYVSFIMASMLYKQCTHFVVYLSFYAIT